MNFLKKPFLVIGAFGFLLYSCEKDVETFGNEPYNVKDGLVDPSNDANSFDYIGFNHNTELISFVDSVRDTTIENADFIYDLYYVEGLPSKTNLENVINQANFEPDNYSGFMANMYHNHSNLFAHYLAVRTIVGDELSLNDKIEDIKTYENAVNYSSYSENEVMALKAMFSVARHSMVLWAESSEGGMDLNAEGGPAKNKYIGGNKNTHDIVMADIGGTFTSALFTWNPVTALAGGVLSSAWEWGLQ